MGRYGPQVSITRFDSAPRELEWQLPLEGELYRLIPGPDRPDYSLLVLERPLHFYPAPGFDLARVEADQRVEDRKGRPMVRVHALLVCARFVGQQLHPGMRDLAVNIAYVIDNSLARDPLVDFAKIEVAAVGYLSEGHAGRAGRPVRRDARDRRPALDGWILDEPAGSLPLESTADVVADAARVLRDGIAAHRQRPVGRLTATLRRGAVTTASPGSRAMPTASRPCRRPTRSTGSTPSSPDLAGSRGRRHRLAPAGGRTGPRARRGPTRRFTVRVEGDAGRADERDPGGPRVTPPALASFTR